MNAKLAKRLRREAKKACDKAGIPSETAYNVLPQRIQYYGAAHTVHQQAVLGTKRAARHDLHHDRAKAVRSGVAINWLLSEVFPFNVVKPQVVLGNCLRGVYQRTKRALS